MSHVAKKKMVRAGALALILAALSTLLWIAPGADPVQAKEELVTLPNRDSVSLTIYNEADLTFVQEERMLGFSKGRNRLQFSWANTLIDPSSVLFESLSDRDIEITGTTYPKESGEMLIWEIDVAESGSFPVRISYFTSGVSWQASYEAITTPKGDEMAMTGYVTVNNLSGEEYEDASVRLIIGNVNLVQEIRDLALAARYAGLRTYYSEPHAGKPTQDPEPSDSVNEDAEGGSAAPEENSAGEREFAKRIVKESVGEYFMYSVEGKETISHGWSKRLIAIKPQQVKTDQRYEYNRQEYGAALQRLIFFRNDAEYELGNEPLPPGPVRVYSRAESGRLSWVGSTQSEYIALGDEVKWNLGADPNVRMETRIMRQRRERLDFESGPTRFNDRLVGYDTELEYVIEFTNFRDVPVEIEFYANPQHPDFDFNNLSADAEVEDAFTRKWQFDLPAGEKKSVAFTVIFHEGSNRK